MLKKSIRTAGICIVAGTICTSAGAQPANDGCASAIIVGLGAHNGTTIGATNDGEAACGNSSNSPDVYYRFTAPATCTYEVLTCDGNTDFDTTLSVHSACPATPGNTVACNDDAGATCFPLRSNLTFAGARGTTYTIRVSGFGGEAGPFTLVIRQVGRPSNDTCGSAFPIVGDTGFLHGDTTCALSDGVQNCAIATTGTPCQYWRWTSPGDGVVTFETCFDTTQYDSYLSASTDCPHSDITILACNDDTCDLRSSMTFGVAAGASYVIRVSGFGGARGSYSLGWTFSGGSSPNDECFGAHPISLGSVTGSTRFASPSISLSCFQFDTPDVFYRFRSPVETFVTFDTCGVGTSFDTVLSVHSGCPANDNVMACNDDACGLGSSVTVSVKPGVDYFVRVAGFRDFGEFVLRASAQVDAVVFDPSTLGEYYLLHDRQNMSEFRGAAASLGARLAAISSFSEGQFVTKAVMQAYNAARSVAIGLSDEVTEGVFRWDTQEPFRYSFFTNGQPDNTNGAEDHVHIHDPITGLWNDYPDGSYQGLFAAAESDRSIIADAINPANGRLYVLFNASSWEGAQARAQAMGGSLVTIDGPAENEFVRSRFGKEVGGRNIWIGLTDVGAEGTFGWADGSASTFRNFGPGEPNNFGGNEDYVEMIPSTGQWNDLANLQGNRPNHGVAEIVLPQIAVGAIRGPGGCGNYMLVGPTNFYPGLFAAEHLHGHLASVTSAAENEFIRSTFAAGGGGRRLWLGATDRDDDGNFIWLTEEPFGYTNFLAGEPNNFGGNEDYIEMFDPATGVWNDISTLDPSAPLHFAVVELQCPCDWNGAGGINSQDFFDFLEDFFGGNADYNCDHSTNSQDFFDFLTCFFSGCA